MAHGRYEGMKIWIPPKSGGKKHIGQYRMYIPFSLLFQTVFSLLNMTVMKLYERICFWNIIPSSVWNVKVRCLITLDDIRRCPCGMHGMYDQMGLHHDKVTRILFLYVYGWDFCSTPKWPLDILCRSESLDTRVFDSLNILIPILLTLISFFQITQKGRCLGTIYNSAYYDHWCHLPLVLHCRVEDISSLTAGLWFLHCKGAPQSQHSDPCPHTALRRALTTLHIYTFLQLMEAPLVVRSQVSNQSLLPAGGWFQTEWILEPPSWQSLPQCLCVPCQQYIHFKDNFNSKQAYKTAFMLRENSLISNS